MGPLRRISLVVKLADLSMRVAMRMRGDAVLMFAVPVVGRRVDVPGQRGRPQGDHRAQQQSRNRSMHEASLHVSSLSER